MHASCTTEFMRSNYRCPQCSASLVDMTHAWRRMDEEVSSTILPADLAGWAVNVHCVDCQRESLTAWSPISGTYKCRARGKPPAGSAAAKDAAVRAASVRVVASAAAAAAGTAAGVPAETANGGSAEQPSLTSAAAAVTDEPEYAGWLCGSYNTQPKGERIRAPPELIRATDAWIAHVLARRLDLQAQAAALVAGGGVEDDDDGEYGSDQSGDVEGSDGDGDDDDDDENDDEDVTARAANVAGGLHEPDSRPGGVGDGGGRREGSSGSGGGMT